jgi:predicted phosphoribosyltransferase
MFENREYGGRRLAEAMQEAGVSIDLVLAVPRGGLPVGRKVADAFGVPLDIIAAKKLGAPSNPELAVGAAAADGSVWLNERLIGQFGLGEEYLDRERESARETAMQKERSYRGDREAEQIAGRAVAIVDDGIATGATMRACIKAVQAQGAERVVVGVPVGPPDTIAELEAMADEVVVVDEPGFFSAVGAFYADFGQVTDEEAMSYLRT